MALLLTSAKASVVINSTNFPDENFLWVVQNDWDTDGNGTLSDEEIAERTHAVLYGVTNFKGIEYFYHITDLLISGLNSDDNPMRNLDLTKFTKLERVEISDYPETTSLDFTKNTNLWSLQISNMYGLTTVQIPASMEYLTMYWCPNLTTVNLAACRENLGELSMQDVAIKDVDVSNFKKLHRIYIEGNDAENIYKLNSLNIAGCDELWSISIQYTDIETVAIKDLPAFMEATVSYNDIRKLTVENCPELLFLDCQENKLPELYIKKCDKFWRIFANNNYMRTLIIDESPLEEVEAADNQLMWLDLSKVVFEKDRLQDAQAPLKIDDQRPHVTAYKLSPTEVGVKVHERFDPSRVIDLTDNGSEVATREFANYDGEVYFVISTRGTEADNLKGGIEYKYDPKWPYPWIDGNSEDNLLPVSLTIDKVLKLDSWIEFPDGFPWKNEAEIGGELNVPQKDNIMCSDGYDGKLTFTSSDENVVKVNAETGAITIVGPGRATITVTGAETDYRTAPASVSYQVVIYPLGDANGDGKVDANDIVEIVNYMMGKPSANFYLKAADANKDNKVDIADIIQIANTILARK